MVDSRLILRPEESRRARGMYLNWMEEVVETCQKKVHFRFTSHFALLGHILEVNKNDDSWLVLEVPPPN